MPLYCVGSSLSPPLISLSLPPPHDRSMGTYARFYQGIRPHIRRSRDFLPTHCLHPLQFGTQGVLSSFLSLSFFVLSAFSPFFFSNSIAVQQLSPHFTSNFAFASQVSASRRDHFYLFSISLSVRLISAFLFVNILSRASLGGPSRSRSVRHFNWPTPPHYLAQRITLFMFIYKCIFDCFISINFCPPSPSPPLPPSPICSHPVARLPPLLRLFFATELPCSTFVSTSSGTLIYATDARFHRTLLSQEHSAHLAHSHGSFCIAHRL